MSDIEMAALPRVSSRRDDHGPSSTPNRQRFRLLSRRPSSSLEAMLDEAFQHPDSKLSHAKSWYRRIAHTFKSELLREMCFLFNSADNEAMIFSDSESLSACFTKIHNDIEVPRSGLRVCAISAATGNFQSAYGLLYETYLILSHRNEEADRILHLIMLSLLQPIWASNEWERELLRLVIIQSNITRRLPESKLLSLRQSDPARIKEAAEMLQETTVPGSLDETSYLQFQWIHKLRQWDSDLEVYIQEPYKARPILDFVRVLILKCDSSDERRIVVAASKPDILRCLKDKLTLAEQASSSKCANSRLLNFIHGIFDIIWSDTLTFVRDANSKVEDINLASRRRPSNGKVQLLVHLQDCYMALAQSLQDVAQTASLVIKSTPSLGFDADAGVGGSLEGIERYHEEFTSQSQKLLEQAGKIPPVKDFVKEQMELSNNSRNTLIGLLVALYVPLAFVTSFFGMNITDSQTIYQTNQSWPVYSAPPAQQPGFSSSRHDQIAKRRHKSPHTPSPTPSPLNPFYTTETSPRTWSFTTFWITAASLTFSTMILPLVVGPTIRWILRFFHDYRVWWRIIALCIMVTTVLALSVPGWIYVVFNVKFEAWYNNYLSGPKFSDRIIYSRSYKAMIALNTFNGFVVAAMSLWNLWVVRKLGLGLSLLFAWGATLILGCAVLLSVIPQVMFYDWNNFYSDKIEINITEGEEYFLAVLPILPWILILLIGALKPDGLWSVQRYRRRLKQMVLERGF